MAIGLKNESDSAELRREASLKLAILARHLRSHFDSNVSQMGVTRSQWTAIAAIARHPGVTQRIIAGFLEVSEVSAGRLIDRLCADGLVVRRPKDEDKRAHAVYLSEAGVALTSRLGEIARANEAAAFAGLGDADIASLVATLDMIEGNLVRDRARGGQQREA
ncbi:MAG: MarR family transcriptional regulator [Novosphingobium sp.]|nr:MarR family transcriptional regulator [Novosphingobium sp.]